MTYKTEAERRMEAPSAGELAFEAAVDEAYNARWWEEHDYVVLTASYMADCGGDYDTYTLQDMASLIEKPWKWTDAYVHAMAWVAEDGIGAYIDTTPPAEVTLTHPPQDRDDLTPEEQAEFDSYVDEDILHPSFRGDR